MRLINENKGNDLTLPIISEGTVIQMIIACLLFTANNVWKQDTLSPPVYVVYVETGGHSLFTVFIAFGNEQFSILDF